MDGKVKALGLGPAPPFTERTDPHPHPHLRPGPVDSWVLPPGVAVSPSEQGKIGLQAS